MIITLLDETVDDNVFVLDVQDGPFRFVIDCAGYDIDPSEWILAWADVDGSDWADAFLGLDDLGNNFTAELKYADPRFVEALLNAPVAHWKWLHYAPAAVR